VLNVGKRSAHDPETFHELFADFESEFRVEAAEHFFANNRVHGCEFAHEFVARLPFGITTPADANGQQGGDCPNGDVSSGDQKGRSFAAGYRLTVIG